MIDKAIELLVLVSNFAVIKPRPYLRFAKLNARSTSILSLLSMYSCFLSTLLSFLGRPNCILDTIGENNRKEEFDNTNEYLIKMNLEADCLKVQFISDASTKELKMMIERLAPVEVGLMVKTWGNGGFLEVDFKESQAIISNK